MTARINPSILSADFVNLEFEVARVSDADGLHVDVMDNHFVPNLTFGPPAVKAFRPHVKTFMDVHLMIERPDHYFPRFSEFSSSISVHVEAPHDVKKTLTGIRQAGCLAGLALSPPTPISAIEPFLGHFDILLVMTVNPGFGGQAFMPEMLEKVQTGKEWREEKGLEFHIEVDGGVGPATAELSRQAGANVMVAGTSVFKAKNAATEIAALR